MTFKPRARFCTKCLEHIDEENPNSEYVMLIAKKGERIKEFYIFHKNCWIQHFKEYYGELANSAKK